MASITVDRQKSDERRKALDAYLRLNVLAGDFICSHYKECRSSHREVFYEGQLHHVGKYYDLMMEGRPFRVVLVGQEYGHEPSHFDSQARYELIMKVARTKYTVRNAHMKGTANALRLLFGIPLGSDNQGEFLTID